MDIEVVEKFVTAADFPKSHQTVTGNKLIACSESGSAPFATTTRCAANNPCSIRFRATLSRKKFTNVTKSYFEMKGKPAQSSNC